MQRDVVEPAVTSCSSIIKRSEVRMRTSTPRARALRRAESIGGAVIFGVWMRILFSAFATSIRMKEFSGVGGARTLSVDEKSWKRGFRR